VLELAAIGAVVEHVSVHIGDQDIDPAVAVVVAEEDAAGDRYGVHGAVPPIVVEPAGIQAARLGHFLHEVALATRHLALLHPAPPRHHPPRPLPHPLARGAPQHPKGRPPPPAPPPAPPPGGGTAPSPRHNPSSAGRRSETKLTSDPLTWGRRPNSRRYPSSR